MRTTIVAALALGAVLLLAYGPRANDAFPKDAVVIDYWEKWTGPEEAAMRQIVGEFNTSIGHDKHIYVRYLSTSAIEQKTKVATAAGVPPDVSGLYNQDIPQFASMDALEPLDAMAASHGIVPATYKKVFWDECCFQGNLYGLVSSAFDLGLYYNKELFQQRAAQLRARGLDPDRPPRTIAELDEYAQAIEQFDSDGHLLVAGYLPLEPGWYQSYTCVWFGGSWWDNVNHKFTFTDPAVVRTYQWIQSYSRRLGAQEENAFRLSLGSFNSPQHPFLSGQVAMEHQGTFLANFIEQYKPSMRGKWGAAAFPTQDPNLKDVTYCNCDVLTIPRGSKHKAQAMEFIAYVNRQDVMEKLANLQGKLSPLANVSEGFLAHHRNPYIRVFDSLAASPNAHPTEPVPIFSEVDDEMNNFVQRLSALQVTPEQGLKEMQDRLQAKYDLFIARERLRHAGQRGRSNG